MLGLKKACRKTSRLIVSGVDLVTAKELLGHSDIKITMRYVHTNREAGACQRV